MPRQEKPFLIRNAKTGAEYEIATLEKFENVYGDDPDWYIATGPNRQSNRQLGERAAAEGAGGGEMDDAQVEAESFEVDANDVQVDEPLADVHTVEGESENV